MSFLLVNLSFLLISLYTYIYFRIGIGAYCKLQRMSKTFIRKNKKGAANYWLYKQLHQQRNLGSLYYINYIFLIGLAVFVFVFLFSWIKWMKIPVVAVGIILGLIEIPAIFKAIVYDNLTEYGTAFVLFRAVKGCNSKRWHFSTALDWISCIFPVTMYIWLLAYVF